MSYTPPAGVAAHFQFNDDSGYTPPAGTVAHFVRVAYYLPSGADFLLWGTPAFAFTVAAPPQVVTLNGTDFCFVWNEFGPYDSLGRREGMRYVNVPIAATGFDSVLFGTPAATN